LLDGQHVVEEYDGSNVWQARYTLEDGWDQPRSMDRADIADVDGDAITTEVLRFHYAQNALGSVSELSQPSGAVVEWTTYDVYGMPTIRNAQGGVIGQSAVGNPFLFTGREWDAETGTYFYRARQYDPERGRFLQRDPIGFEAGLNLYQYVRSAPIAHVDPTGLKEKGVFDHIGEALKDVADAIGDAMHEAAKVVPLLGLIEVANEISPLNKAVIEKIEDVHVAVDKKIAEGTGLTPKAATGWRAFVEMLLIRHGSKVMRGRPKGKAAEPSSGPTPPKPPGAVTPGASPIPVPAPSIPPGSGPIIFGPEKGPMSGGPPCGIHSRVGKSGRVVQNTIYDSNGLPVGHVDFRPHGGQPSGHGHNFPPGEPGPGHGPGAPHIPPGQLPPDWLRTPPGLLPEKPIGSK